MDDKRAKMCLDSLLAEAERLRILIEFQRRQAEIHCAKIAELDVENGRLRAELADVRGALPDTELLKRAAKYAEITWARENDPGLGCEELADAQKLYAAARIRAVQEAHDE